MKQLTILLITTILASSVFADEEEINWSKNLLVNPGAETGKLIEKEWQVWTDTVEILSSYQYNLHYRTVFPNKGNYFFSFTKSQKITQKVDVSSYASSIDNDKLKIKAGAFFNNYNSGNFECLVRIQYYDQQSTFLDEGSEKIDCSKQDWLKQSITKTIPAGTRSIFFNIRYSIISCGTCKMLMDDAYLYISTDQSSTTSSPTNTSAKGTTSNLKFTGVKSSYNVGETVKINLQEDKQFFTRTENVDLWVIIQLPTENLLFMTDDVFNPFTSRQQRFKSAITTNETAHKILEFKVRQGIGGKYIFSALYVQQGKNPMEGFLWQRSNVAIANIVLNN
jgi:hypothetical protein